MKTCVRFQVRNLQPRGGGLGTDGKSRMSRFLPSDFLQEVTEITEMKIENSVSSVASCEEVEGVMGLGSRQESFRQSNSIEPFTMNRKFDPR